MTIPIPNVQEIIPPKQKNDTAITVYLDISQSMMGFALRGEQYQKTLWELRGMLNTQHTSVYLVSDQVAEAPKGVETFSEAIWNRSLYRETQDNLAAAIRQFNPESANEKARIHILITDSVPSLYRPSNVEGCDQGADWFCVKQELKTLLENNWAGCVIGIRSHFDGQIFPEANGGRSTIYYKSNPAAVSTYRPFYIYLFSPQRELLANFVSQFKEKLSDTLAPGSYEMAEFTSLAALNPATIKNIEYPRNQNLSISKDESEGNNSNLHNYSRLLIRSTVEELNPKAISLTLSSNSLQEDSEINWKLVNIYYSQHPDKKPSERKISERDRSLRYAEVKMVDNQRLTDEITSKFQSGQTTLQLKLDWLPDTGYPGWRIYRLDGFTRSPASLPWVRDWATDDDTSSEQGNKTLYLDRLVGELWRASPSKDRKHFEIYLWVGPKDK